MMNRSGNIVVFDCEIEKAIPAPGEHKISGFEYCDGWNDFEGMGISVIGAYDYLTGRSHVFLNDNIDIFRCLVDRAEIVVGFNSIDFDNRLCAEFGIDIPEDKTFDIMIELLLAAGEKYPFHHTDRRGYSLDAVAKVNFDGIAKTGTGLMAPFEWQAGNLGTVINYCLSDVHIAKKLVDAIITTGGLWSPKYDNVWHDLNLKPGTLQEIKQK